MLLGAFKPDHLQFLRDDARDFLRAFKPVFRQVKADVFADSQRIQQRAGLEHHRHPIFVHHFRRLNRFALDQNFARVRLLQADEMLEQHAFAAAARSHDDEDLARVDVEIEPLSTSWPLKLLRRPRTWTLTPLLIVGWAFIISQEKPGEEVIEDHDQHDRVHHRFGDRAANPRGPPLVTNPWWQETTPMTNAKTKLLNTPLTTSFTSTTSRSVVKKLVKGDIDAVIRKRNHRAAEPADQDRRKSPAAAAQPQWRSAGAEPGNGSG